MEGQCGQENPLQLMPLAFGLNTCNVLHPSQGNPSQQFVTMDGRNPLLPVHLPQPQWIDYYQTSHNYVEYHAENGFSEIPRELLHNNPGMLSSFEAADSTVGMDVWKKQESNEAHSRVAVAEPALRTKKRDPISRQRATSADRARRVKIAERLNALGNLLLLDPKKGNKASQFDDTIDHIKSLQLQIKDLSQSRLGGEPTSDPFIFLEGYGHYLLNEHVLNEPLEEMMGKLMEVNPLAALKLIESRGLVLLPTALAGELNQLFEG